MRLCKRWFTHMRCKYGLHYLSDFSLNIVIFGIRLFEVLRLYPSVPGNQKEALEDDVWPDGTRILKGDQVSWQPFTQGRLEKIWGSDAKEFKPERWISPTDGTLIRVSPYQWSAFNAGPRVCLGKFAVFEYQIERDH